MSIVIDKEAELDNYESIFDDEKKDVQLTKNEEKNTVKGDDNSENEKNDYNNDEINNKEKKENIEKLNKDNEIIKVIFKENTLS